MNVMQDKIADLAHDMRKVAGLAENLFHGVFNMFDDDTELDINHRIVMSRAGEMMCALYGISDRDMPKYRGGTLGDYRETFYEWIDGQVAEAQEKKNA